MELDPSRLLLLQLDLERVGFDDRGLLVRLPGDNPDPDEIARVAVYRHAHGVLTFFRHDVPETTRDAIAQLPPERIWSDPDGVAAIVGREATAPVIASYVTYVIDRPSIAGLHPGVRGLPHVRARSGLEIDGAVAATCESVREAARCGEAWVLTEPAWRRQGLAQRATCAWATDLLRRGLVPFYSHRPENVASQALARSVGARHVFDVRCFT